jgi:hypothetical protein
VAASGVTVDDVDEVAESAVVAAGFTAGSTGDAPPVTVIRDIDCAGDVTVPGFGAEMVAAAAEMVAEAADIVAADADITAFALGAPRTPVLADAVSAAAGTPTPGAISITGVEAAATIDSGTTTAGDCDAAFHFAAGDAVATWVATAAGSPFFAAGLKPA